MDIYIWIWIIKYKQKKLGTQALLLFKNADTPITNRCIPGTKKMTVKAVARLRKRKLQCLGSKNGSCK